MLPETGFVVIADRFVLCGNNENKFTAGRTIIFKKIPDSRQVTAQIGAQFNNVNGCADFTVEIADYMIFIIDPPSGMPF